MGEYEGPEWLAEYQDFKALCAYACGEYIKFYLTTGYEHVVYSHSQKTEGLPRYTCQFDAPDGARLELQLGDWRQRMELVAPEVRQWLGVHSDLRGSEPTQSHYAGDPYWKKQLQIANDWERAPEKKDPALKPHKLKW